MMVGPRNRQEDCIVDGTAVFQADLLTRKNRFDAPHLLLAVCDGMGGHKGGETASMFACEQLHRIDWENRFSAAEILDVMAGIQRDAMWFLPQNSGTTVAGLLAGDGVTIAFNAGDSRIYQLFPDSIAYISHDHSRVQEMVDMDLVDTGLASRHPFKNLIEFGIGPVFEKAWLLRQTYLYETGLQTPAYYLLCSDGLTDIMADHAIHELLMPDPVENGPRLYNALKRQGLKDNTSFVIAEIR